MSHVRRGKAESAIVRGGTFTSPTALAMLGRRPSWIEFQRFVDLKTIASWEFPG